MNSDASIYLTIVSNTSKMKMLADYIERLPANLKCGDEIIRFVSYVRLGDKANVVSSFRDLPKIQQLIVAEAFKKLLLTDEQEIFESHMGRKVPALIDKAEVHKTMEK